MNLVAETGGGGACARDFRHYNNPLRITFDPAKRARTLAERGLDFADAALVFAGWTATKPDDRRDYGEPRFITAGYLNGRMFVLVWTQRGDIRRLALVRIRGGGARLGSAPEGRL